MEASQLPTKIPVPFGSSAASGTIRTVPVPSQIAITPGAASFTTGFPLLNTLAEAAGGIPPFGQDMNGVLLAISSWIMWQGAGGQVVYDAAFSASIGGYPKGALLTAVSVANAQWLCLVDNNVTDPDTGGAGWLIVNLEAGPGAVARPYFLAVISNVVASPPVTSNDGDAYLVPVGATGGWTGQDNNVAIWSASLAAWSYTNYPTESMVGIASIPDFYQRNADGTWSSIFDNEDANMFFLGMM
jgi:hypothetical protein